MMKYIDIKDKDWDSREVKASNIVLAVIDAIEKENPTNLQKIVERVEKLPVKRKNEIDNAFGRKGTMDNIMRNIVKKVNLFDIEELDRLIDDIDLYGYLLPMYLIIYVDLQSRALPLSDSNISDNEPFDRFSNARMTMMELLRRTGKTKEALKILSMTLDRKPDTVHTFLDKKMLDVKRTLLKKNMTKSKVKFIVLAMRKNLLDNYENDIKAMMKQIKKQKPLPIPVTTKKGLINTTKLEKYAIQLLSLSKASQLEKNLKSIIVD